MESTAKCKGGSDDSPLLGEHDCSMMHQGDRVLADGYGLQCETKVPAKTWGHVRLDSPTPAQEAR